MNSCLFWGWIEFEWCWWHIIEKEIIKLSNDTTFMYDDEATKYISPQTWIAGLFWGVYNSCYFNFAEYKPVYLMPTSSADMPAWGAPPLPSPGRGLLLASMPSSKSFSSRLAWSRWYSSTISSDLGNQCNSSSSNPLTLETIQQIIFTRQQQQKKKILISLSKHNIKSKFPPKEPHQICQCNKLFKLKPSMGYS